MNLVFKTATPAPATGLASQVTTNLFDGMGRMTNTLLPDGTIVTNLYTATGQMATNCGSRVYPVADGYDAQGRMNAMTNWTNFTSGTQQRPGGHALEL